MLDTLLALAVERVVQTTRPAAWASMKSLHLLGPELPVFKVVEDVLDSPTGFLWRRFQGLRRHLDITIAGIVTGPRTVSVVTVPVSPADTVSALVRTKVPTADVVLQRITLRLAADTYDEPHAITIEVLGHDPGQRRPAGVRRRGGDLGGGRRAPEALLGGDRRPRAADPPVRRRGHRLGRAPYPSWTGSRR